MSSAVGLVIVARSRPEPSWLLTIAIGPFPWFQRRERGYHHLCPI